MQKFLFTAILLTIGIAAACSSASAPSGNGSTTNGSSNTATNVPPEFSQTPITPSGESTPGIPSANAANLTNLPKGTTPTPGIPDPASIGKTPVPKGATPTPGIPDEKTLKEQMKRVITNVNAVNEVPKNVKEAEKKIDEKLKNVRNKP